MEKKRTEGVQRADWSRWSVYMGSGSFVGRDSLLGRRSAGGLGCLDGEEKRGDVRGVEGGRVGVEGRSIKGGGEAVCVCVCVWVFASVVQWTCD